MWDARPLNFNFLSFLRTVYRVKKGGSQTSKKGVTDFKKGGSQTSRVCHFPLNVKQMPAELWVTLVLTMYQVLCAVPMHVSTTSSSSGQKKKDYAAFKKFLVSLESPDQHFLLLP